MTTDPGLPRPFLNAAGEFVRRRTGLIFREARGSAFAAGLDRAMHRAKLTDPEAYLAQLQARPALVDDLVGEITVGETYFLREPQQLAMIRDRILPALALDRSPGRPLRIWSAGCATGEEPYSLAMVLSEQGLADVAHVVASDLSRTALALARRAVYTRWSLRGVPDHVVRKHFDHAGNRFTLSPAIRDAVDFRYLNLAEDTYPSLSTGIWGMDLILCRNVLIYFDAETIARVAGRLIDSLSDNGWLVLGASDPPLRELAPCEVVLTDAGFAYRRRGRSAPPIASSEAATPLVVSLPAETPAVEPVETPRAPDFDAVARSYAERDYERAAEQARRLVERDGSDPAPWIVLVRALANRGDLSGAGQGCAAALDRHRDSAELTYLHAVLLAEAGRTADAATAARRALYLDRQLVVAHLVLGRTLALLGDVPGARRALRNAQRVLTNSSPEEIVPASDGELAGRLTEMARVQLQLLPGAAA